MKSLENTETLPLKELILKTLTHMKKGSADEVAMEIMEIKGISSEEGVSELIQETKKELEKLVDEKKVLKIKPHGEKSRYVINEGNIF